MEVDVLEEHVQKVGAACAAAMLSKIPGVDRSLLQGNPFMGKRAVDMVRTYFYKTGQTAAFAADEKEIVRSALGQRSANVSTGMFNSHVLANVMDKALSLGFASFDKQSTWRKWTRVREVSDFKTFTGAALDSGNLVKTAENAPFPELGRAEFGYSSALEMWGVTAALTFQALINDDLGEFVAQIFRAGAIANRTIEKEVYASLEGATWTDNTVGSAGLGTGAAPTPAGLDVARNAFVGKLGPAGEQLGNKPRFLIHQATQGVPVGVALGRVINYGGVSGSAESQTLEPIETTFLSGTATTYYLVGDPTLCDTVIVAMLKGMDQPQIEEFDGGAGAARKWKLYLPFKAKPVITQIGSTYYAPGMQQATAA